MIRNILFDLFFTLADPHGSMEKEECISIGISYPKWREIVWDEEFTFQRNIGYYRSCDQILERIISLIPFSVSSQQRRAIHQAKENRMFQALTDLPENIIPLLEKLRSEGYRLGLVSNADAYDILHWNESPLSRYLDTVVFSCQRGMLKPDPAVYRYALQQLNAEASETVYVGDGGSNEMYGAKKVGLSTIWTEQLIRWNGQEREQIMKYSDYHITNMCAIDKLIHNL